MSRRFLVALLFAAFICLLTAEAFSQDNDSIWTVETEGKGIIANDDLARARSNAISDALRKAVEQAVAFLTHGQTLDKNSQAIRDQIYARSDQYIRDYRINKERQTQDTYAVDVRSAVFIDSIRDNLQTIGLLKTEKSRVQATEIVLTVKGLTSCGDYSRAKELLKTRVKGVRDVYQRELTWGTAKLILDIQGTVQSFADELMKVGHFSPIIGFIDQKYFEVTFSK